MNLSDIKSFAEAMAPVVREYVDEATAPLLKRIDELERRAGEPPVLAIAAPELTDDLIAEMKAYAAQATEAAVEGAVKAAKEIVAALPPTFEASILAKIEEMEARDSARFETMSAANAVMNQAVRADCERLVEAFAKGMERVQEIADGQPDAVRALIDEAIAAIPKPEPGLSVHAGLAVQEIVREEINALAAKPEDIERQIGERVAEAFAAIPPAKDGDSVDPEAVKVMVDEAVAAIPKAKDGDSVTAEDVAPLIAEEVARAVAALPPAEPGKDADPEVVREIVREEVAIAAPTKEEALQLAADIEQRLADLPVPKDGQPGKDADPEVTRAMLEEMVAALPRPQDGKSITLDDVTPLVAETVEKAVAALPAPKDGIGLAGAIKDHEGHLILTLTNGEMRDIGQVDGKDGELGKDAEPGKDGADGLGFDDLDLTFDGERKLVATFTKGEVSKAIEIEFPVILDRGVYKAGKAYLRGDAVTWGGALWIAQRDTSDKPETSDAFRLAVKMGRNGQDGKNGERGEKGDPGRDGKALS